MNEHFSGDQKRLDHFLRGFERKLIDCFMPLVPGWMSTVHLTMMTLFWSGLVVYCGYLASGEIAWLWGFSACIFLQHITDMLDGEVGRRKHEGLVKWGFYMDHFLDYTFICAIVIGYSFLLPGSYVLYVLMCLAACGGFMVHTMMDFAITHDFKISFNRFGVAEVRWLLIVLNAILVFTGRDLFVSIFPFVALGVPIALFFVVFESQKVYKRMDQSAMKQNRYESTQHERSDGKNV